MGEWSDRASFELYRRDHGARSVEAAVLESGDYVICERLIFYGSFAYRAQAVGCGIVR